MSSDGCHNCANNERGGCIVQGDPLPFPADGGFDCLLQCLRTASFSEGIEAAASVLDAAEFTLSMPLDPPARPEEICRAFRLVADHLAKHIRSLAPAESLRARLDAMSPEGRAAVARRLSALMSEVDGRPPCDKCLLPSDRDADPASGIILCSLCALSSPSSTTPTEK
jgi:hypothetical protein